MIKQGIDREKRLSLQGLNPENLCKWRIIIKLTDPAHPDPDVDAAAAAPHWGFSCSIA